MIKYLKTWWQVKKMKKATWKRVAIEQARQDEETRLMKEHAKEFVDAWLKENEFGLTLAMLSTNCMSSVARNAARNIDKNITEC